MISLSHNEAFFIDEAPLSFAKAKLNVLFLDKLNNIFKRKKCVFDAVNFFFRSLIIHPEFLGYDVVKSPVVVKYKFNPTKTIHDLFIRIRKLQYI
jgi:hypothetical protein